MSPIWGCSSQNTIEKIQIAQNKILKIIYRKPRRFNTIKLYEEAAENNIIMFKHLLELETNVLIYKIANKIIHINVTIPIGTEISHHNTRSAGHLRRPNYITKSAQNSVFYRGIILFNSLPGYIKNSTNLHDFKQKLRNKYKSSLNIN